MQSIQHSTFLNLQQPALRSLRLSSAVARGLAAALVVLTSLLGSATAQAQETFAEGDLITVRVFGQDDLTTRTRVGEDGLINMPLINQIKVAGKQPRQVEQDIAYQLERQGFLRNAQVSVLLESSVVSDGESATVLGNVRRPGRFSLSSAADGTRSLVGLLAMAGGVTPEAADYVLLSRRDANGKMRKADRVDLIGMLNAGSLIEQESINGGDVLYVPRMDEVYVYGQVKKPGRYRLESGMTVIQALAVSGGLTARGTEKGLSVRRQADKGNRLNTLKVTLDDALAPGDVLYVKEGLF